MKEKLMAEWARKYERILWELKDNDKKLESVTKRQKELVYDLIFQCGFALVCFLALYCITINRYAITVDAGYFYSEGFYYILVMALVIGTIAAVIYNGYQIIKRIKSCLFHNKKRGSVEYPKPEVYRSNYSTHIPSDYYSERKCIEWLLHQYNEEIMKLIALRREIENAPEQDLALFQRELESIVIYQRVGRAR